MIMLYIHKTYQGIVMLLFYVNMIITGHDSTSIELKQFWSEKFEMKDQGSLAYISWGLRYFLLVMTYSYLRLSMAQISFLGLN